jgi:hypothetical protein
VTDNLVLVPTLAVVAALWVLAVDETHNHADSPHHHYPQSSLKVMNRNQSPPPAYSQAMYSHHQVRG